MQSIDTSHLTLIHSAKCAKLSDKATGFLAYSVWANPENQELFISLTENENGGYFSPELLPVADIITALTALAASQKPFYANSLQSIFVGKSANNASFLAAVLKDQGILEADLAHPRFNSVSANVHTWQDTLLSLLNGQQSQESAKPSNSKTKVAKAASESDIQG